MTIYKTIKAIADEIEAHQTLVEPIDEYWYCDVLGISRDDAKRATVRLVTPTIEAKRACRALGIDVE